jgi:hypothetical protein
MREQLVYQYVLGRIRDVVFKLLPPTAIVGVISKGDDELLSLGGRSAWHFPQTDEGIYAGDYPADSAAAVDHLETLRSRGAQYFLIPCTAFWWIEHYSGFRQHLDSSYRRIWDDEHCILYQLAESQPTALQHVSVQHDLARLRQVWSDDRCVVYHLVEPAADQVRVLAEEKDAAQREAMALRLILAEQTEHLRALTAKIENATAREAEFRAALSGPRELLVQPGREERISASHPPTVPSGQDDAVGGSPTGEAR